MCAMTCRPACGRASFAPAHVAVLLAGPSERAGRALQRSSRHRTARTKCRSARSRMPLSTETKKARAAPRRALSRSSEMLPALTWFGCVRRTACSVRERFLEKSAALHCNRAAGDVGLAPDRAAWDIIVVGDTRCSSEAQARRVCRERNGPAAVEGKSLVGNGRECEAAVGGRGLSGGTVAF